MKILLVDDHALIREAMRGALQELEGNVIILEASSGHEGIEACARNADIDLVLLDLSLPDRDGFSLLGELRESHPSLAVVVMSGLQDRETVLKALDLGALGFIPKSAQRKVILSALQLVIAGGIYIPSQALDQTNEVPALRSAVGTPTLGSKTADTLVAARHDDIRARSPADLGLTERQVDVLALIMQGKSNKAICRSLNLAEPTVKNHVTAILKALKVTNRTEAVIAVGEMKWDMPKMSGQ